MTKVIEASLLSNQKKRHFILGEEQRNCLWKINRSLQRPHVLHFPDKRVGLIYIQIPVNILKFSVSDT